MTRRTAATALLVGVVGPACGVVLWASLRAASIGSRPVFLAAAGAAVMAVARIVTHVRVPPAAPAPAYGDADRPGPRAVADLVTLEHRLAWASVDPERFESRVRPLLAGIAAERLRHRHGVDHTVDPERAREIVGESLWQLMTGPAPERGEAAAPSHREMVRMVARIEEI